MFFIILSIGSIVLFDLKELLKEKKDKRLLLLYFIFMATTLWVGILISIGKRPISPSEIIEDILKIIGVVK